MKNLKLALLGTMIAATSINASALESMTDSALSSATGQDGLSVTIDGTVNADYIYIHDNDGYVPTAIGLTAADTFGIASASPGAITLGENGTSFSITKAAGNTGPLAVVQIDADGNTAGTSAVLNVNIQTGALDITTGEIGVARSNRTALDTDFSTGTGIAATGYAKILDSITVKLGALNTNIQLGSAPQGSLIKFTGSITGGLALDNLTVYDNDGVTGAVCAAGDCGVRIGKLTIADTAGGDLSLNGVTIDIGSTGLLVNTGTAANTYHIGMESVSMGTLATANSIGDIEIGGLQGGTTIAIAGH